MLLIPGGEGCTSLLLYFASNFLERGYITGYSGDWPKIGPWQYRLMGFKNPPTDFYTRPFFSMAEKLLKGKDQCLASKTISKVQFDYIREVFDMFKKQLKFFFSFNGKARVAALSKAMRTRENI